MALTDEQVMTGKMYSYLHDGDEKMAVLEIITLPIKGMRWCRFDNGDQITLDSFKETAQDIEGGQNFQNQPVHQPVHESQNTAMPSIDIVTDEEGNPILGTNPSGGGGGDGMGELSEIVTTPTEYKKNQVANDPVIKLLEKANTTENILSIEIPVQLVDKKLFNVLVESFGEESKETICKFVMDSVSPEHFKDAVMKMIEEHYGKTEE